MVSEVVKLSHVAIVRVEEFKQSLCRLNECVESSLRSMRVGERDDAEYYALQAIQRQIDRAFDGISNFANVEVDARKVKAKRDPFFGA